MVLEANQQTAIIRTERGLTIAGTRITLYDVMAYLIGRHPPKFIRSLFDLTEAQMDAALSYIEENRAVIEAEYQTVLKEAEETRQYWEERNREHFTRITAMPRKPEHEALWAKLQEQKAEHASDA